MMWVTTTLRLEANEFFRNASTGLLPMEVKPVFHDSFRLYFLSVHTSPYLLIQSSETE